jgi:putative transposase
MLSQYLTEETPMPRRPRLISPGVPLHIIQRGNNRQACFFSDVDYLCYLEWLQKYAEESGCSIHAYVLMTNHVHLLLTPSTAGKSMGSDSIDRISIPKFL